MNNCFPLCSWANKVMSFVPSCPCCSSAWMISGYGQCWFWPCPLHAKIFLDCPETWWDYGLEMVRSLNSLQMFVWKRFSSNICPGSFSTKWYPWSHPCMGPYEPLVMPFSYSFITRWTCLPVENVPKRWFLGIPHFTQSSILLCLNLVDICCWFQIQNKQIFTKLSICTWNTLSLYYIDILHSIPKCFWIQLDVLLWGRFQNMDANAKIYPV